jgi:hypothetical protein
MGNIHCNKCFKEVTNLSANFCTHCGHKLVRSSLDESKPYTHFLTEKNKFFDKYLPDKKTFLNSILSDELHIKIVKQACYYATISWARAPGRVRRIPDISNLKNDLIKIYKRYYNVYNKGHMPPGIVRLAIDPTNQNFKNRMKIVLKNYYNITQYD